MKPLPASLRFGVLAGALSFLDFAYRSASGGSVTWFSAGLSVLSGILLAIVLVWIVPRLVASKRTIIAVLGFTLFIVEFAVNMVEGYFFSTVFPSVGSFLLALPPVAGVAFLQAGLAAALWPGGGSDSSGAAAGRTYTASRGPGNWMIRSVAVAVAYLPVYLAFGALVGPMVLTYYTDSQTGLVLPPMPTILLVELFRGALYVLGLVPLLALLRWHRWEAFFAIAALIYVPGSFLPLVTRTWLPAPVILLQSLELLGDALVYSFILSRVLAPGKTGARVHGHEPSKMTLTGSR